MPSRVHRPAVARVLWTVVTSSVLIATSSWASWSTEFSAPPDGHGVDGPLGCRVLALHGWNGRLIAGGDFSIAGETIAQNIAAWDGETWHTLGDGLNGTVRVLATYRGDLIAGGSFTASGAVPLANIARWDGNTWSALGAGMDDAVHALVEFEGELIAGGEFTTADNAPASRLAVWDGAQWTARGDFESTVEDLIVFQGEVIAGGEFEEVDDVQVDHLARWHGTGWSSVGGGTDGPVRSLTAHDGRLIAGGSFTLVGSQPASNIASWDGESWFALGGGTAGAVRTVICYRTDLIVGGSFQSAGSVSADRIARWDGSQWSSLDDGLDDEAWSLRQQDGRLFVGGLFQNAGDVSASRLAVWDDDTPSGIEYHVIADGTGDFTSVQDAVEAVSAANDVIRVHAASFDEDVVIDEKIVEIISVPSVEKPEVRTISWRNDSDQQVDTGGRLEGLHIAADVSAERLSSSTSLTDCTVGASINLTVLPLDGIQVEASRCTVATRLVFQGEGDEHRFDASVDHCVLAEPGAILTVLANNAHVANTEFLDRGDLQVHGENEATVTDCLIADGSVEVFGLRTRGSVTSCSILGGLNVYSWVRAQAHGNSIIGSARVHSSVGSVVTENLFQGGTVTVLADEWSDVSSNVIIGSPGPGLRTASRGSFVGNTVVGCGGPGILWESPEVDSDLARNLCVGNAVGMELINPMSPFLPVCNNSWGNGTDWVGLDDPTGMDGNISEDPRFCDFDAFDLGLAAGSVCLPGNHPGGCNSDLIGAVGQSCELPASGVDDDPLPSTAEARVRVSVQPNPVRDRVRIELQSQAGSRMTVRILDVTGREVEVIRRVMQSPAESIEWNPGSRVKSGVYFVIAEDGLARHAQRFTLVR